MEDFEEKFVTLLYLGLSWRWKSIHVESECMSKDGIHKCVVRIYYPDEYKKQHPTWDREYVHPINQAVGHILHSVGLGCLMGDATPDGQGFFTFWSARSEKVYDVLPPLNGALAPEDAMPADLR